MADALFVEIQLLMVPKAPAVPPGYLPWDKHKDSPHYTLPCMLMGPCTFPIFCRDVDPLTNQAQGTLMFIVASAFDVRGESTEYIGSQIQEPGVTAHERDAQ